MRASARVRARMRPNDGGRERERGGEGTERARSGKKSILGAEFESKQSIFMSGIYWNIERWLEIVLRLGGLARLIPRHNV